MTFRTTGGLQLHAEDAYHRRPEALDQRVTRFRQSTPAREHRPDGGLLPRQQRLQDGGADVGDAYNGFNVAGGAGFPQDSSLVSIMEGDSRQDRDGGVAGEKYIELDMEAEISEEGRTPRTLSAPGQRHPCTIHDMLPSVCVRPSTRPASQEEGGSGRDAGVVSCVRLCLLGVY